MTLTYWTRCDGCGASTEGWDGPDSWADYVAISFPQSDKPQEHYCGTCWAAMKAVFPEKISHG